MNYYIQGDAANADQIRAAFEKLGYDISWPEGCANPAVINIGVERNGAKYVVAETSEYIKDIIKTHPDYKELKLPDEPKFRVGKWVVFNNSHNSIYQISEIRDSYYMLTHTHGGSIPLSFSQEELLRPWTIEDANDGDILATTKVRSCPFIYRKASYNNELAYYYAGIDGNGDFCEGCLKRTLFHFGSVENVVPATQEQRVLLFAKMKEAGYEWYAGKKELKKISKHYDISSFYAGMPVLVRETSLNAWQYVLFSHCYIGGDGLTRFNAGLVGFTQCIPFEGNEHLLGTTDMPNEEYINW